MRHLLVVLLIFLGLARAVAIDYRPAEAPNVDLVVFYGEGCPHCVTLRQFLQSIAPKYPALRFREYEVYFDSGNAQLFERIARGYHSRIEGVPTLFLGDRTLFGFSADMEPELERMITQCLEQQCASPLRRQADLASQTLTLPAIVLGAAVDAINPCEFAVLIILMATIFAAAGRRRALHVGLAFSLAVFISYYLMGLGLFSAIQAAGVVRGLQVAAALLAIVIGLFNLKDYFWYGKGFLMEVPLNWRPTLKSMIQGVTSVPGAFLIGFAVSLFLLPCTSGPYIVIVGLLASVATRTDAMLSLLLYNAIFIAPMVAITVGVYFGLTTAEGAEEWRLRNLKLLHLITGTTMLLLGIAVLALLRAGYL